VKNHREVSAVLDLESTATCVVLLQLKKTAGQQLFGGSNQK